MKQQKKFIHNGCVYFCKTNQKVGDSNYNKNVQIFYLGSVAYGWNAKNNTPMAEIIEQAKLTIDNPNKYLLS